MFSFQDMEQLDNIRESFQRKLDKLRDKLETRLAEVNQNLMETEPETGEFKCSSCRFNRSCTRPIGYQIHSQFQCTDCKKTGLCGKCVDSWFRDTVCLDCYPGSTEVKRSQLGVRHALNLVIDYDY